MSSRPTVAHRPLESDLIKPLTERACFVLDEGDVPGLCRVLSKLAAVSYSESVVRQRLGLEDLADLQWRSAPIYRAERLADYDALAMAIDLFLLQGTLPAADLGQLFAQSESNLLIRAGLLAIDDVGIVKARASLFPVGDRLIFSDHAWPGLPHPGYATVPYDQVMGIGLDSHLLARCTARRPFRAALDVCTGSGIHALLASTHSERVVAVDINPRAACCTRFNAQASGITNLEVRTGDLFEVVRGERFDLITANPPFVPSPLGNLQFRDGGRSGEDILKRIVAGLPHHLAANGIAQIVAELGERDGEPIAHRLREWLAGAPLDIHVLRLGEYTATKYAIGHAKGDDYQTFLGSIAEWTSNLRQQSYTRVASVVISFQWSDTTCGPPWERVDQSPPPRRAAGAEIDATFLAEHLIRHPDWQKVFRQNLLARAGPIAIIDARVLGSDITPKTKATLLGQALKIEYEVDPVEREILDRLQGRISGPDLIRILRSLDVDEPTLIAAVRSLLLHRLVRIEDLSY